jgi:HSP20 family protein
MDLKRKTGGLDSYFREDFFDGNWSGQSNRMDTGTRLPAVNIKESEDDFEIHVAASGMEKKDFEINVDNKVLSISVEEKIENEEKGKKGNFKRSEFSFTSFKRAFSLPSTVEENNMEVSYDNGMLKITIPKKEESKPNPKRQIPIG